MQPLLPGRAEPTTQRNAVATLAAVGCVAFATFAWTQTGSAHTNLYAVPATQVAQATRVIGTPLYGHAGQQVNSGRSYDVERYPMPAPVQSGMNFQQAVPQQSVQPALVWGAIGALALAVGAVVGRLTSVQSQPVAMAAGYGIMEETEEYKKMVFPWWEDTRYQAQVIPRFPEDGVASPEEARVLWHCGGYDILDIRTSHERSDKGYVRIEKGDVHIPLIDGPFKWNSELQRKAYDQKINPKFLDQVRARFPNKDAKIVIMCSDGRDRALQVLMMLDDEGYNGIVGMQGGFNNWDRFFSPKGVRRDVGEATEVYDAVDSEGNTISGCGLHASGAGFEIMDSFKMDLAPINDPTEWLSWEDEMAGTGSSWHSKEETSSYGAPAASSAPAQSSSSWDAPAAPAPAATPKPDADAWNSW